MNDAYVYLNLITLVSSMIAIIALFILYLASRKHLAPFYIDVKFAVVGLALFCSNIQILVLDVLTFTGVIPCSKPFDWETRASSESMSIVKNPSPTGASIQVSDWWGKSKKNCNFFRRALHEIS